MRANTDSTLKVAAAPAKRGELVSIFVPDDHPLLQLKGALDWEAIREVMVKPWRAAGKNVDGGAGPAWPVSFSVPRVAWKRVKSWHSRSMEESLNESVVARRFLGRSHQSEMHIRDHAHMARAEAA